MIAPLLGGVILAKAGSNAVFGLTLGIIGMDFRLRLLVVEKANATIQLARYEKDGGHPIQQDDPEQNRPRSARKDEEFHIETQLVTVEASQRMKIPAIISLLSSRRLCVALGVLKFAMPPSRKLIAKFR